ncbi:MULTISPECIES: thioredoxin family protein [Sphingobacterium]|uniref:thioredoxin family protein n=1 Tax=Sphingobacterium TaxID=28453 RepID=UPI0013D9A264|nr:MULTISPECIES: thioredoxin family protein [unclassified Sphingobacterium]
MKTIFVATVLAILSNLAYSQTRFEKAKKEAAEKRELIVLNFSGSDWCIPCIKFHKNIIETDVFQKLISGNTAIYLNVDFPRSKKNQPLEAIKKENAELADLYNPKGIFPYTLVLDADGKIIKTWEGLPAENAEAFASQIQRLYNKGQ